MSNRPVMLPPQAAPEFGTLGIPANTKETGQRADFRLDSLFISIEGHGYRLAWTRAATCPCQPLNDQTEQSDPNCQLCMGSGYLYFGPTGGNDFAKVGQLTPVQLRIIQEQNAYVIRGLMTSLGKDETPWDKIGGVRMGTASVTVRPENRLGYYDRLVQLDSTIVYREVVMAGDPGQPVKARYLIDGGVNLCRSQTRDYRNDADFNVVNGQIVFLKQRAPSPGTRLAIHYYTHPTWLVMDAPHVIRSTNINYKTSTPQTPEGNFFDMPIMAGLKLEFLETPRGKPIPDANYRSAPGLSQITEASS